ncbi:MAG: copper resistance protein NlpE [Thermomonas sp.]
MNRKLLAIALAATIAATAGCKPDEAAEAAAAPVAPAAPVNAVTDVVDHASPAGNAKDFDIKAFAGTYGGMLPCADCPGIDSTIAFTPEGTYTLSETYQDADKSSFLSKGTWSVRGDGKAVLLDPEDKDEYDRSFSIVSPTELRALDQQGKPLDGSQEFSLKRK